MGVITDFRYPMNEPYPVLSYINSKMRFFPLRRANLIAATEYCMHKLITICEKVTMFFLYMSSTCIWYSIYVCIRQEALFPSSQIFNQMGTYSSHCINTSILYIHRTNHKYRKFPPSIRFPTFLHIYVHIEYSVAAFLFYYSAL